MKITIGDRVYNSLAQLLAEPVELRGSTYEQCRQALQAATEGRRISTTHREVHHDVRRAQKLECVECRFVDR